MKKFFVVFFILVLRIGSIFGQENNSGGNLYTVFLNIVNEDFRFPLIGFINIADGDHYLPQIGFINWNQNDLKTLQTGFINNVGGNFAGLQIGFINVASQLSGLQLGFINYVDTVESGVPIGFLSFVRNGGYKALEVGVTETASASFSLKIGIKKFYTSLSVAYNPFNDEIHRRIFYGFGFGTIIDLNESFFINPELLSNSNANAEFKSHLSFIPQIGYNITPNIGILFGPSISWIHGKKYTPFINLTIHEFDKYNSLSLGAKVSLRFQI